MSWKEDTDIFDVDFIGGIYAPIQPRRVLHTEIVEFRMEELRRRQPKIVDDDCFADVWVVNDGQREA